MLPHSASDAEVANAYQAALSALQAGNPAQAKEICRAILEVRPEHFDSLCLQGAMALHRGDFDGAIDLLGQALAAEPDNPNRAGAYNNIGIAFARLQLWQDAIDSYKEALTLTPDNGGIHFNLANAWRGLGNSKAAIECYDQAIVHNPAAYDAYYNRGVTLRDSKQYEAAIESFARSIELNPDNNPLYGFMLYTKMQICDWSDLESHLAKLSMLIEDGKKVTQPFPVLSLLDSPAHQRAAAEIWAAQECRPSADLGAIPAWTHRKIRVGYFSMNYSNHPVSYLIAGLIEAHDREKFEIYAFSYGPNTDDKMRKRMEAAFDHFLDVRGKSDAEIAALARAHEIDIAVDMAGYTTNARPGIFAVRAAPVQVNFGFPGTMGLRTIDYMIADNVLVPPANRAYYSEAIAALPSFQPNDAGRKIAARTPSRAELGLPEKGFVFCAFNNSYKITPETLDRWARILAQVEGSVLWLTDGGPSATDNLRREALRRGISSDCLVFAPRVASSEEHLARFRAADLFLDTRPYNAQVTASDALWAGLPLLTWPTETWSGRVAASLLSALDLPELVVPSAAAYEALAVELATDPDRLARLREKLQRNRLTSPLFNTAQFARNLEAAFTQMHDRALAGLPPAHIHIA